MDLSTLETTTVAEQGAKMEVQHPVSGAVLTDTSGAALTITLAGQDSERFRKADRAITNKRLATQASGRRVALTSEGLEADSIARLVACTISWSGIEFGGSPKECTPDNVREAYKRLPWLREQVERFVEDRANFLRTPSAS
ncbi:hypothetical protein ABID82_002285 [Methylobacterium sp. PvP062]|uniref:Uncharacterized protein n=1 Tax=Methylobacterium radiotolerans TaxID=31998 RepID=A0ABV2NN17_9HYPH|nr:MULTISPECIES: hypothetical protein [unclassified Methylobacterium]MBP2495382.1 hypothetical protein [Methylobacterium sp. PvP105]MBP2504747.1 hypothetical protein [Methylobacterium sp. PvP109]MCX7335757.1 hypothetical protein [Hyphomicrobiales bacterium]